MSGFELLLGLVCVTAGAAVQSTIGFGAALVSVPLLLLLDPRLVPGPVTVAGLGLNLLMLGADPGHADWRGARWAVLGLLPGTAVAAVALVRFTGHSLTVVSCAAVLAAVGTCAAGLRPRSRRRTFAAAGFWSGYLGTTAGVGGPPLALAYQEASGRTLRATLPIVFVASALLTLGVLAGTGHLAAADWRAGLVLAPGGAIGRLATRGLVDRVDGRRLRGAVLVVSASSALVGLLRVLG